MKDISPQKVARGAIEHGTTYGDVTKADNYLQYIRGTLREGGEKFE